MVLLPQDTGFMQCLIFAGRSVDEKQFNGCHSLSCLWKAYHWQEQEAKSSVSHDNSHRAKTIPMSILST